MLECWHGWVSASSAHALLLVLATDCAAKSGELANDLFTTAIETEICDFCQGQMMDQSACGCKHRQSWLAVAPFTVTSPQSFQVPFFSKRVANVMGSPCNMSAVSREISNA